jgi:hypothetical protein
MSDCRITWEPSRHEIGRVAGTGARHGDFVGAERSADLAEALAIRSDFDRGDRIGEFWGYPESRTFGELLIDFGEDRVLRAMLVGMLREADR